ncbi:MAG TPA: hypothetical protein VE825_14155 [Terriglobales bacterium]|jgi:hypothetical protein|nr:hypothetical protein [Terriglobales bacterium]
MLSINETLVTHDPAQALRNEAGIFELISPTGEKFQLTCRAGQSIVSFRYVPKGHNESREWQVKKVAELRSEAEHSQAA